MASLAWRGRACLSRFCLRPPANSHCASLSSVAQIYREDGTLSEQNGLDWFESAIARPQAVLNDLVRAAYTEPAKVRGGRAARGPAGACRGLPRGGHCHLEGAATWIALPGHAGTSCSGTASAAPCAR
jgi:hypothetical protein